MISVREQDGPATVHEVRTGRKARVDSVRETGSQIELWLGERQAPPPEPGERRP